MRRRISATRWPECETVDDDSQGVRLATMQELARYWSTDYDWGWREARQNAVRTQAACASAPSSQSQQRLQARARPCARLRRLRTPNERITRGSTRVVDEVSAVRAPACAVPCSSQAERREKASLERKLGLLGEGHSSAYVAAAATSPRLLLRAAADHEQQSGQCCRRRPRWLPVRGSGSAAGTAWDFCIGPVVSRDRASTEARLWRRAGQSAPIYAPLLPAGAASLGSVSLPDRMEAVGISGCCPRGLN
jgi:Epoxide hydrolase N terminus